MKIYIPSYGRSARQFTLEKFSQKLLDRTTLLVQYRERDLYLKYKNKCQVTILPPEITTIAPTRKYIIDGSSEKFTFILDDDLEFAKRKENDWHLKRIKGEPVEEIFDELLQWLAMGYVHVGVSAREGNNRVKEDFTENTRYMRFVGYDVDVLRKENIQVDRMEVMEDFDVNLQLLRKGYPSRVSFKFAQGQGESGAKGGCSHFRTKELQRRNAWQLAAFHPNFVKVTNKVTKTAWGGGERTDVRVYWKKAYESSKLQKLF